MDGLGAARACGCGGANFELADAVAVFQPFFEHARDVLPDVPLWNPHVMGGRPFLANAQSAIFSPFTLPAYVLPFWKSLAVMAMLKLFVAAFGTYLLGRALGMRFGGALLAGVVFAFGTFFVVWLAWPLTNIFPLLPWLLLLTELVVRRPGPLPAAGLAGARGAGSSSAATPRRASTCWWPRSSSSPSACCSRGGAAAATRAARRGRRWPSGSRWPAGAAIAAVMLVPLLELFCQLRRLRAAARIASRATLDARYLGAVPPVRLLGAPDPDAARAAS